MASRILGMGDMLTLIEQAQQAFDEDEAERMAGKLASGNDFTLEDFLEQMLAIRKLGPISNLLGMLPGMGQMKEQIENIDDRDLDRTAAIIRSMTPLERAEPKIINGSRRARIAKGSGVTVSEVNSLVDRFFEARKMMQQMAGAMGLPGARRRTKAVKGKKGRKGKARGAGPTPPKVRGVPGGMPALPPGALNQLPPGMTMPDLSKLNLPKGR
jgi:signal recognition particle subunit SRP54